MKECRITKKKKKRPNVEGMITCKIPSQLHNVGTRRRGVSSVTHCHCVCHYDVDSQASVMTVMTVNDDSEGVSINH